MKLKEFSAKITALVMCGCIACSMTACSQSGNTESGSENSKSSASSQAGEEDSKSDESELTKVPEYEIMDGDFKLIKSHYAEESDTVSGCIHYGKYYCFDDYKVFYEDSRDVFSSFDNFTFNAANFDDGSMGTTNTPENDKNIMYLRSGSSHAIELDDTGDVFQAFMAGNGTDMICLAQSRIRAINTDDGSVTWEAKAPEGMCFDDDYTYDYERNSKLVIHTAGDDVKSFFTVINLQDGSSEKLTASGMISDENDVETSSVENASDIFYNVIVCGDKYLCKTNLKGLLGTDVYIVVDENGEIVFSSAMSNERFSVSDDKIWIDDAAYTYDGKFMFKLFGSNNDEFYDDGDSPNSCRIWLVYNNDLTYDSDYVADSGYSYNTAYTPYVAGTVTQNVNSLAVGYYNDETFLNGSDYIMNAKTGEKLENAQVYTQYTGSKGIACDDYAYIIKDKKQYISSSDFELFDIPDGAAVYDFDNKTDSEYFAYVSSDEKLHYVNKSTKEEKTVDAKGTSDGSRKKSTVMINGDFILYTCNDNTELHALNTKTDEDSVVFTAKEDQFVKFSEEKKENNWFIIGNVSGDDVTYNYAVLK